MLDGELEFTVGEETIRGGRGTFAHIPPGAVHTFANPGADTARWIGIFSPATGSDRLEGGGPAFANPAEPDLDLMTSVFARHRVEVLGGSRQG